MSRRGRKSCCTPTPLARGRRRYVFVSLSFISAFKPFRRIKGYHRVPDHADCRKSLEMGSQREAVQSSGLGGLILYLGLFVRSSVFRAAACWSYSSFPSFLSFFLYVTALLLSRSPKALYRMRCRCCEVKISPLPPTRFGRSGALFRAL